MHKRVLFFLIIVSALLINSCNEPKGFEKPITTVKGFVDFRTKIGEFADYQINLITYDRDASFDPYGDSPIYDQININADGTFSEDYSDLSWDFAYYLVVSTDSMASSFHNIKIGEENEISLLIEEVCKLKVSLKNDSSDNTGLFLQVFSDHRIYNSVSIYEQIKDTTMYFKAFTNSYFKTVLCIRNPELPDCIVDSVYVDLVGTLQVDIRY